MQVGAGAVQNVSNDPICLRTCQCAAEGAWGEHGHHDSARLFGSLDPGPDYLAAAAAAASAQFRGCVPSSTGEYPIGLGSWI